MIFILYIGFSYESKAISYGYYRLENTVVCLELSPCNHADIIVKFYLVFSFVINQLINPIITGTKAMPNVTFFRPTDPPQGANRLINELRNCLQAPEYSEFYFAVAFAKVGPLLRLVAEFEKWKNDHKRVDGIFGIDLKGTSKQALEFSKTLFDRVYITHNPIVTTFHPKMYLFKGDTIARAYIGSQNLTVGGTELNFEGGVRIDIELPGEDAVWQDAYSAWECLLPASCNNTKELTAELFQQLIDGDYLIDEMARKPGGASAPKPKAGTATPGIFPSTPPAPPSSVKLPKKYKKAAAQPAKPPAAAPAAPQLTPTVTSTYQALAIQIIPHDNGEIFLSKRALDQSPAFFGYPFTGLTTPKFAKNPSYPMRDPDPKVTLDLYDNQGSPIHHEDIQNLNMVYYTTKSDIRITINATLARQIPPYSILVMQLTDPTSPWDYELHIFYPGSQIHASYLAQCDQTLPSGGKPVPRKMGWL